MPRPCRIGITCDFEVTTDRRGAPAPRYVLGVPYVDAVLAAGGEPWLLPHLTPERATSLLEMLDGLVVSGGDFDVPPAYYGETPRPGLGRLNEQRSAFELALLADAQARGVPVLGICGGMQLLNVVRGGTLYQDLSERPGTADHQQKQDKRQPHHSLAITPGTQLAAIVATAELMVNSTHHQVVRNLGQNLVAAATAGDGVIEAIESKDGPWALGVQWHPEAMATEVQLRLYGALVRAAQSRSK